MSDLLYIKESKLVFKYFTVGENFIATIKMRNNFCYPLKMIIRGLRVITFQGAIKKSPILLSQYWKNEWLDDTIIISYFGGSNNIFADFKCVWYNKNSFYEFKKNEIII